MLAQNTTRTLIRGKGSDLIMELACLINEFRHELDDEAVALALKISRNLVYTEEKESND